MPLPFLIGGAACVAAVTGIGSGIHGGVKMKGASDTMKAAQSKQERAVQRFEANNNETTESMDQLGKKELEILSSFERFSNVLEKIQGRPEFKGVNVDGVNLPEYEAEELKKISAGAGALLGGIGGAAAGTAGGFAAAGATTSAVMALGTASTGTAISTLSGAAATNAALAALGGGSLAAGGGGMALGTAILGGATLGVGLLVGGMIFNATGNKLSSKADEAMRQANRTEREVNEIVNYLSELRSISNRCYKTVCNVSDQYYSHLGDLEHIVNFQEKTEWSEFTDKEKKTTENTVLLVGLLYKMCQVKLVLQSGSDDKPNEVNKSEAVEVIDNANKVLFEEFNDKKQYSNLEEMGPIYRVSLLDAGPNKVKAIKIVREVTGEGLQRAKELVESSENMPGVDLLDVPKPVAMSIKQKFEDIGGRVDIVDVDYL